MKPLKWATDKEKSKYMRMRQAQNRLASASNKNENWLESRLMAETVYKWTRQAQWGYRLFDFWCSDIGVAIEVDGPEHNKGYDQYRDEYNFRRSAIVVIRVRNRNESDADEAISLVRQIESWQDRRKRLGLLANTKEARRWMVNFPDSRVLVKEYIASIKAGTSTLYIPKTVFG